MPRKRTKAEEIRNPEHYFNRTIALEIKNDQKTRKNINIHECSLEEQIERSANFEAKYLSRGGEYEDFMAELEGVEQFAWIETIRNPTLYKNINALSKDYQQILTMLVIFGLSQRQIAKQMGVHQNVIYKKIKIIKKKLGEGWSKQ